MTETVGLLQATIDAIAESDNEIGGLQQTRITSPVEQLVPLQGRFTWDGTTTVLTNDTTGIEVGDFIQLDEDGQSFEILSIVPNTSVEIDADGKVIPTGPSQRPPPALPFPAFQWNLGTDDLAVDVTPFNDDLITVGMWLRGPNTYWFQIEAIPHPEFPASTWFVKIANPFGLPLPVGLLTSYISPNPVTSKVTMSVSVETTLNWPESGAVAIDSILYFYASKTLDPPSIDDVSYVKGGESIVGFRQRHNTQTVVTDLSSQRSGVELVRRAMLVDYAESEDLNAIGRNLGVLRYPFLESDDVFREIIKALAYNPRGTMYGLEIAMTAMVGEGNFELYEDLINYPCTVFVKLVGEAAAVDEFVGKTYLTGQEFQEPATQFSVPISAEVVEQGTVHSVRYREENFFHDFRNQFPTDIVEELYEGDPGTQMWSSGGGTYNQIPGEGVEIIDFSSFFGGGYSRGGSANNLSIGAESYVSFNVVMLFDSTGTFYSSDAFQWGLWIVADRDVGCGLYNRDASTVYFGLSAGSGLLGGTAAAVVLNKDQYYDIELRKYGQFRVDLLVDGKLVARRPYNSFFTTSSGFLWMGPRDTSKTGNKGRIKQAGVRITNSKDYWNSQSTFGVTSVANPTRFDTNLNVFIDPDDLGKRFQVLNADVANPYGGYGNGVYIIDSIVDAQNVELVGATQQNATVQSLYPKRIVVDPRQQQFVFPDDLGKTIEIVSSDQGNEGSYIIEKLLDPVSLVDFASFSTVIREVTNVCEVVSAVFVSETDIPWRLNPNFVSDGGVHWVLSDAGSVSGTTLTIRTPGLETVGGGYPPCAISFSEVLSAQLLLDFAIKNQLIQELPDVKFEYYPFYLTDPLGFIRAYLEDLTAAGVIPEFSLE